MTDPNPLLTTLRQSADQPVVKRIEHSIEHGRDRHLNCINPPAFATAPVIQLPAEFVIIFDPVTHSTQFIDGKGGTDARPPEPLDGDQSWSRPE